MGSFLRLFLSGGRQFTVGHGGSRQGRNGGFAAPAFLLCPRGGFRHTVVFRRVVFRQTMLCWAVSCPAVGRCRFLYEAGLLLPCGGGGVYLLLYRTCLSNAK